MEKYQKDEAQRLWEFMRDLNALFQKYEIDEPIDIIAHSQGTMIVMQSLLLGQQLSRNPGADAATKATKVNSVLSLASTCTADVAKEIIPVILGMMNGVFYNIYSTKDEAAPFRRGITENGDWRGLKGQKRFENVNLTPVAPNHSDFVNKQELVPKFYAPKLGQPGKKFGEQLKTNEEFRKAFQALLAKYRIK